MIILFAAIGVVAILIGLKGFTAAGLPWSATKNITGQPVRVIGTVCIILGLGFIAFCAWFAWKVSQ